MALKPSNILPSNILKPSNILPELSHVFQLSHVFPELSHVFQALTVACVSTSLDSGPLTGLVCGTNGAGGDVFDRNVQFSPHRMYIDEF